MSVHPILLIRRALSIANTTITEPNEANILKQTARIPDRGARKKPSDSHETIRAIKPQENPCNFLHEPIFGLVCGRMV